MRKEYYPRDGSRITDSQAKEYGDCFDEIANNNGGGLTAQLVVDEAKITKGLLHNYFEWNNKKAGDKHRLSQARDLIRNIKVKYYDLGPEKRTVDGGRAWENLVTEDDNLPNAPRIYLPKLVIMNDDALRGRLIHRALEEVRIWQKRYRRLHELSDVFSAIQKVRKKVS